MRHAAACTVLCDAMLNGQAVRDKIINTITVKAIHIVCCEC